MRQPVLRNTGSGDHRVVHIARRISRYLTFKPLIVISNKYDATLWRIHVEPRHHAPKFLVIRKPLQFGSKTSDRPEPECKANERKSYHSDVQRTRRICSEC